MHKRQESRKIVNQDIFQNEKFQSLTAKVILRANLVRKKLTTIILKNKIFLFFKKIHNIN